MRPSKKNYFEKSAADVWRYPSANPKPVRKTDLLPVAKRRAKKAKPRSAHPLTAQINCELKKKEEKSERKPAKTRE